MSRYLFVVPPLTGHVNPAVGLAKELQSRGHEVAWVAQTSVVGHLLPDNALVYPAGDSLMADAHLRLAKRSGLRGASALRLLWTELLIPLTFTMAPFVRFAVRRFKPDVIVSDQQAFAGGIIAEQFGIPWVTSATTSVELVNPLNLVPKVASWVAEILEFLQHSLDVPAERRGAFDVRFSPYLTLVYSTLELIGHVDVDANFAFVGPVFNGRPVRCDFKWDWLDRHERNILISLGTLSADIGEPFLSKCVQAVTGAPYGVVIVTPFALGPLPANVLTVPLVPQLELLPHLDAVVSHGGHNTIVETLSHSLPIVVAPIRDDQPVLAHQVDQAGAGRRVSFARVTAEGLREAINAVLEDPSYRVGASRIAESFASAGGVKAAASAVERLTFDAPIQSADQSTAHVGG